MDYTESERKTLSMLKRTNFQHLSKGEVVSIVSAIAQMRPEVAREALAQYPEFVGLMKNVVSSYKDTLGTVISSDDASIKEYYGIANSELASLSDDRKQFYDCIKHTHDDLSKALDLPDLSQEERKEILDREMELVRLADKKDTEIRQRKKEIEEHAYEKDTQKREFNWKMIAAFGSVTLLLVGIGGSFLGANIRIKPQLKF